MPGGPCQDPRAWAATASPPAHDARRDDSRRPSHPGFPAAHAQPAEAAWQHRGRPGSEPGPGPGPGPGPRPWVVPAMPAPAPSLPRDSMQPISESTPMRGWAAAAPEGLGALPQGFAPDERRRRPTPPELQSPSSPSTSMGKDRESLRSFTPYSAAPSSPSGAGAGSKAASAGAFAEREFRGAVKARGATEEPDSELQPALDLPWGVPVPSPVNLGDSVFLEGEDGFRRHLRQTSVVAQRLWAVVSAQEVRLAELRRAAVMSPEEQAALEEARESYAGAEDLAGRTQAEARELEDRVRSLHGRRQELVSLLESTQAQVAAGHGPPRASAASPGGRSERQPVVLLGEDKRKAQRLQTRLLRLQGQGERIAEISAQIQGETRELEREAFRLEGEQEAAAERARAAEAERCLLWERLALLAAAGQGAFAQDASLKELAEAVGQHWTEATQRADKRKADFEELTERRAALDARLVEEGARLRRLSEEIAGAGRQVGAEEQELRSRGRMAQEELRLAKAERTMLREAARDWRQRQPRLLAVVEELRVGNREGSACRRELGDKLASVRNLVERRAAADEDSGEDDDLDDDACQAMRRRLSDLEDERDRLITEQEDLIRSVKAQVAPIQRAVGLVA